MTYYRAKYGHDAGAYRRVQQRDLAGIVATDLPEIRRFNADHGDLVAIAADAEDFSAAITRALALSNWELLASP